MHEWYFLDQEPNHRGQLSVRPSVLHGYGLHTLAPIPNGHAIGIWSGSTFNEDDWEVDRYGLEIHYDRRETFVVTPVQGGVVDFSRHPFASMNEPSRGSISNVYMRVEEYDEGGLVYLMAVFYAARDIEAGEELLWHYGETYKREYEHGSACVVGDPPLNDNRFRDALLHRPDGVYAVELDSSDSSDGGEWV